MILARTFCAIFVAICGVTASEAAEFEALGVNPVHENCFFPIIKALMGTDIGSTLRAPPEAAMPASPDVGRPPHFATMPKRATMAGPL